MYLLWSKQLQQIMANFSSYLQVVLGVDLGSISCEVAFPEFGEGFSVVCVYVHHLFPPWSVEIWYITAKFSRTKSSHFNV